MVAQVRRMANEQTEAAPKGLKAQITQPFPTTSFVLPLISPDYLILNFTPIPQNEKQLNIYVANVL